MSEGESKENDRIGSGFFSTLFELGKWIREQKSAEVRSLKELADKKFSELDYTHSQFFEMLLKLRKTAQAATARLDQTDDIETVIREVKNEVEFVADLRRETAGKRRASYEEASVYTRNSLRPVGVFANIPGQVSSDLRQFMEAYCQYFEREDLYYRHDVAHVLTIVQRHIFLLLDKNKGDIVGLRQDAHRATAMIIERVNEAEEILGSRWQVVAANYHMLGLSLRRAGVR
jgi:hypothetical protein